MAEIFYAGSRVTSYVENERLWKIVQAVGWLVGRSVGHFRFLWAKIAVSQPICLKFGMDVPNIPDFENEQFWLFRRYLVVGWSVNLTKLAKIAISLPIWLKFGMDVILPILMVG